MTGPVRIALVGDHDASVTAHRAIPPALALAAESLGATVEPTWLHTSTIDPVASALIPFDGVWVVPASPYANADGVFAAIRYARETKTPFLGTCGGFQYAVIEYARNVLGLTDADHGETNPGGPANVIDRLTCSLVGNTGEIMFAEGSRVREAYGRDRAVEGYHCNFGPNPAFESQFISSGGMTIVGRDAAGEARAVELTGHPFFVGTLFQPERSSLRGEVHPLIRAFVGACQRDHNPITPATSDKSAKA
jgi:CTP synthase (UTP-ammonia lyase)